MSGIKSRKKLKITAEMAAEDSFRYGLWEECNEPPALDKVCFWYKFIKSKDFPTSKKNDRIYKADFNKHLALLNKTFMKEESSIFKLKWTSNGLGVFARYDMKIVRHDEVGYGHDTGLSADYQRLVEGINWSIGMVTINKSTVGRPKYIETGKRKPSDRIRGNTMELIKKSLVGPFNFINHACDECAQLEWEENAVKNSIHVTAKKGKRIKKDDEVFINYKGVKCEDGDVFPCGMCSKSTAASAEPSTAASTATSSIPTSSASAEPSTAASTATSSIPTSTAAVPSTAACTAASSLPTSSLPTSTAPVSELSEPSTAALSIASTTTSTASTASCTNDMEIDDETAELNKINEEVKAMIIKATSKQRKKKKKKAASILTNTSTVSSSFTANNNEQDIDMIEDAGCIEVSNAIAAAANAATVAAIKSHGLKNNNKKISGTGDNDDSSVDSSDSVIDLDVLLSSSGRGSAATTTITRSGCNINQFTTSNASEEETTENNNNNNDVDNNNNNNDDDDMDDDMDVDDNVSVDEVDDDDEDDDDEDDLLIIDKGTLIAHDVDNRTMYGIVVEMVDNNWSVKCKYTDEYNHTHTGIKLFDNEFIESAYDYFQNLPVENKDVGYAMFGLKEFDVVIHTAELGFTYYNDSIIGKNMVQSSTSCLVNNNDILVSVGDENVFGVEYQQFVEIVGRHDERPINIRFRRTIRG
jgi:hypothetical protein